MIEALRHGWKVLTHDLCSPIQGGLPLWNGITLPHSLPAVALDAGDAVCAAGWNYCTTLGEALYIGGLWPTGRPSVGVMVEAGGDAIQRGKKCRSSTLTVLRRASEKEVGDAIHQHSACFGTHAEAMAAEQIAWRAALSRPGRDADCVEASFRLALDTRGLSTWTLRRYDTAREAEAAGAAWAAWDAWGARDAGAALTVYYSASQGWVQAPANLLTTGIRDAYANGLAIAIPTDNRVLGWAMEEDERREGE